MVGLGGNWLYSSKCDFVSLLFGIEMTGKRFSPLKRRSEIAASSPHIRLSSVKLFPRLRSLQSSLADASHCSMMGSVQILTLAKARVVFYIVLQSTGLTFPTSSLSRDDYVWMLLLCIAKKICAKLNLTHRVIFFYYPLFLNYHSLLRHLLTSEFAVLLFDCERHKLAAQSIP